ncbi:MAG: hypothetical protein JWR60_697 [Polaromonas sp.]|nr:hypothetical protein [Polaromonas sp.]
MVQADVGADAGKVRNASNELDLDRRAKGSVVSCHLAAARVTR